jgi:hypothetical protein
VIFHSVQRDIKLERHYPFDLRNRVVGARLQKDGKLPYSYAWTPSDGPRYYDRANKNNGSDPSNITASPFFHQLLTPIIEWPMRTISIFWFIMEYVFLGGIIAMVCLMARQPALKWLVINVGIIFTLTETWKNLIAAGQLYLFEGFLICLICFALVRNKKTSILFAGTLAAFFVLTRPIGIVLFIPFLFNYKKNLLFLSTAFITLGLYGVMVMNSSYQRNLYRDYVKNMKIQVLIHQGLYTEAAPSQYYLKNPFSVLEGFDFRKSDELEKGDHIIVHHESPNLFVVYTVLTHSKIPLTVLNLTSAGVIILLSILFYLRNRSHPANELQIILFGFALYMIVEIFNPVYRHEYNIVQWFPLVLTGLLVNKSWKSPENILIFLGLLLSIGNIAWIPMRHTVGEICWLTAILFITLSPGINASTWKLQS